MSRRVIFSVCLLYRKDADIWWWIWSPLGVFENWSWSLSSQPMTKREGSIQSCTNAWKISLDSQLWLFNCLYLQTSTAAFKSFLESRAKICSSSSGIISTAIIAWPILIRSLYSPWKKTMDWSTIFSCIKNFRFWGRKSGLLTKHGIADKSLAWRSGLRDADDIRSRLVISQNAQE